MDALDLAGYVVKKGLDNSTPVTNLQLQKILYFLQIRSLQENPNNTIIDKPNFEAWKFGPVIRRVYDKFCLSGGMPIIVFSKSVKTDANIEPYIRTCIQELCRVDPWDLVAFAHRKDGAWAKSYIEGYKEKIKDSDIFCEAQNLPPNFIQSIENV